MKRPPDRGLFNSCVGWCYTICKPCADTPDLTIYQGAFLGGDSLGLSSFADYGTTRHVYFEYAGGSCK